MSAYPTSASGLNYITYPVGPTATGVTITANASNNTKGSYTQLVASTPFACQMIQVSIQAGTSAADITYLLDIATGGAGSETDIVANLLVDNQNTISANESVRQFIVPIAIASGVRLSARCQCSTGSDTLEIAVTLISTNGAPGLTSAVTVGASTGTSRGTQIDPGGTANTKGSWVQMVASTASTYQWLMLMMDNFGQTSPAASARWAIDIGTGGAGSEVVLVPDLRVARGTTPIVCAPTMYPILTYIPSGTRVAVRASCSINTATSRLFDAAIVFGVAPVESGSGGGAWAFA